MLALRQSILAAPTKMYEVPNDDSHDETERDIGQYVENYGHGFVNSFSGFTIPYYGWPSQ